MAIMRAGVLRTIESSLSGVDEQTVPIAAVCPPPRHLVLYVLHSSNLYGTERMALATAMGLSKDFQTVILGTCLDLARVIKPYLQQHRSFTFVGTGPRYNLVCIAMNMFFRKRVKQVQIVQGGTGHFKDPLENIKKDYSRKKVLNYFNVTFVTVSDWSKQQLVRFGVRKPIHVVANFLTNENSSAIRLRTRYVQDGIKNVVIVSRVDHVKRLDLLLDALDRKKAELANLSFRILGTGPELDSLSERARRSHPNVEFVGFCNDVPGEMARADLFLHTCPVEPFGLVVLEAMAARLATLVPDEGGPASIIEDGVCGFTFRANDADHLASRLVELHNAPVDLLNKMVDSATSRVETQYSREESLRQYRGIFSPN
jgi:glycosyltransferase involved in cell wall biosynthesis